MEEFKNLNWLWKTNRSTTSKLYDKKFDDDEKDIFFCHLNEIDHIHLLDNYSRNALRTEDIFIRTDPRTGKIVSKELYDHTTFPKTLLFARFPQRSSMNSQQHQSCLNAIAKLKTDTTDASMSDRNDIRVYAQLSLERSKEKLKFSEFVKDEFYKRNIKNCYDLRPELNKFITKRLEESVQRVLLASSNNYFQLQSAIPIQSDGSGKFTVEFEETIKASGHVLTVNTNKYSNPVHLSCTYLDNFFANSADIIVPLDEKFLQSHSVDVVITLKTLSSILNSAKNLSTDWNVRLRLEPCDDKNVIIFDEMLPAVTVGCLEKNRLAYKYGVKAGIAVPKKKEVFSFEDNRFIERVHPTDGHGSTSKTHQEAVSEFKVSVIEEYMKNFSASFSTNHDLTSDSNHIRRLWNVKRNNVNCCRLVIDNSQDYCEKQKDGTVKHINLSPKLEYQCEFGGEQMTLSELISDWCDLRFGPNTVTHRVRIDARSACLQEVSKDISIADVEYDLQRLYQMKAEHILEPFFNFIEIIKKFPPNEYLLCHLAKHKAQAMVYVKTNETSPTNATRIADIYKNYQTDSSNLETLPWNPIDDTICTSIHTAGVMPCAFPHWIKKDKNAKDSTALTNDRVRLVEKALRKDQEKEEQKLNVIRKMKALKKQRSKDKRQNMKKILAKRPKLNFDGEPLDPNDLFDEQGNISIGNLANRIEENDQPIEDNILSETLNFEAYCRDAAVIFDDSIEHKNSHTINDDL